MLFDPDGKLLGNSPRFEESLLVADIKAKLTEIPAPFGQDYTNFHEKVSQVGKSSTIEIPIIKPQKKLSNLPELSISHLGRLESVYHALIIGTRDYLKKTGFKKVIIAVSGGIDSALVTTIALSLIHI